MLTGSSRSGLANDLSQRLYTAIYTNYERMADLVEDYAQSIVGLETKNKQWSWCYRFNTTYVDCPIAKYKEQ